MVIWVIQLTVLADDLTGALDTGVQFAARGVSVKVVVAPKQGLPKLTENIRVLIIDTETRHLSAGEAYQTVYRIAEDVSQSGCPNLYKKTDSALRGNIGSEFQAVLDVWGGALHFVPAFPTMGRCTLHGIQYINAVPVSESVFGSDPLEPVRHSRIADIIREQTAEAVFPAGAGVDVKEQPGIHIYDASTDEELRQIGAALRLKHRLRLTAGCAGFAAVLPGLLGLQGATAPRRPICRSLLVGCGSANPITLKQLDEAEARGFPRFRLTPRQALEPNWLESSECEELVRSCQEQLRSRRRCLLDSTGCGRDEVRQYAIEHGANQTQLRLRISGAVGTILQKILAQEQDAAVLVTGGDTLLAFIHQLGIETLTPHYELLPGVVFSEGVYHGHTCCLISKSGGFGEHSLIPEVARKVCVEADGGETEC